MKFNGLTNEGKAYLAKIKTNHGTIEFKSMKFGDGSLLSYENPETFKKLKNQKSEKEILDKISNRDTITLNAVVDNTALRNGYYLREIGIFVSDQGREILFFYMNDGDETSFVPPETDGPYQAEIGINLVISNVESIVVNNESSDLYVTKAFVERKLKEKQDVIVWKSGGNLEKTNLTENDSNKLFTAKGALDLFNKLTSLISEKEPKILKKNGFNLSKSDADDLDSSSTLATSRAVKKVRDALNKLNLTWGSITNKPVFGLRVGDFMEGHRLAESLGVKEYGGLISSYGQKIAGNAYYDSNTKKMFYCKETNSYTSANSTYFEPFDNKELLNRLNNLNKIEVKQVFDGNHTREGFVCDLPDGWLACNIESYLGFHNSQSTTIFNTGRSNRTYDVELGDDGSEGSITIKYNKIYLHGRGAGLDVVIHRISVLI
ncbi:phage tail protein [Fusobacterium necrophorum]|uniref:phage tail-collar fiber domain-containing protein n=1 Tax=Fusobacterium necrophorum TaxID=859 RepID=UPI00254EF1F7|nr:phage tail protein [Fusobacterium necrophorum]MDK4485008.1 phage tail protein [Fusobacterium necrophorum]